MPSNKLSILLIEDNPGDVRLIEEMLDRAADGAESATGSNEVRMGELQHVDRMDQGLQRLSDDVFDVVLLDLGLPDSTGIDTLESVRGQSRNTPIVVLTGLADETVGDQAVQRGAQEYLIKNELTPPLLRRSLRHAIERKKFERTQTALHRASRNLVQATSKADVCQLTVDAAVDVLGLSGIGIYLFDDSANVLQPTAYTDYFNEIFDEMPSFGPDDMVITWQAFIDSATITLDDVRESEPVQWLDPSLGSGIWIPLGDHGVMACVSEEVGRFDQQTQQLADHLAATAEATLDRVEREETLREHEHELATQNRQLEELNRMNELLREIDQVLVQATTRDAIEQAVCERFTRDERFAFAWIGEAIDDERVRPRTWDGADRGYLDAISLATDTDNPPPAVTASSTKAVALTPNVATDLRDAPWRKAALTRGLHSAISIPLTHNELSYGILTVFATEPEAFDTRSEEVFEELGETIANAMNSVETRQALLTDTIVELELAIQEPDDLLGRLAREADCQIGYGGIVPQSDRMSRIFFSASGAPASEIQSIAEEMPSLQRLRQISYSDSDDDTGDHRFEVTVSGPTIPKTLVECGAAIRSIQVIESETRIVVELPGTVGVRTFIDRLETTYSDIRLIARRDRERSEQPRQSFEAALANQLTDRQLEVLHTAYLSGYFEWPRERTGEEVAESLSITQPTFNGHLRTAERKLCAMVFDGSPSPST